MKSIVIYFLLIIVVLLHSSLNERLAMNKHVLSRNSSSGSSTLTGDILYYVDTGKNVPFREGYIPNQSQLNHTNHTGGNNSTSSNAKNNVFIAANNPVPK